MVLTDTSTGAKAGRRHTGPEQVGLVIERVEHLVVEVNTAAAVTQLIDGLDRRLAILEDATPSVGTLMAQSSRLTQLEELVRTGSSNGHAGS